MMNEQRQKVSYHNDESTRYSRSSDKFSLHTCRFSFLPISALLLSERTPSDLVLLHAIVRIRLFSLRS